MKRLIIISTLLVGALSAESFSFTKNIRVIKSHPQYETVSNDEPYQECRDVRVRVDRAYGGGYDNQDKDRVAGSIIGGTIGGVIGHQIGEGKGKDVATVGGAILGTIVGGNMASNRSQAQGVYSQPQYQTKRECVTKYRRRASQRRLSGYENIAFYQGREIKKYSDEPLSYIPVTITVSY